LERKINKKNIPWVRSGKRAGKTLKLRAPFGKRRRLGWKKKKEKKNQGGQGQNNPVGGGAQKVVEKKTMLKSGNPQGVRRWPRLTLKLVNKQMNELSCPTGGNGEMPRVSRNSNLEVNNGKGETLFSKRRWE